MRRIVHPLTPPLAAPLSYVKVTCRDFPPGYYSRHALLSKEGKILGLFLFFDPADLVARREALTAANALAEVLAYQHDRHATVSEWQGPAAGCDLVRGVVPRSAAA